MDSDLSPVWVLWLCFVGGWSIRLSIYGKKWDDKFYLFAFGFLLVVGALAWKYFGNYFFLLVAYFLLLFSPIATSTFPDMRSEKLEKDAWRIVAEFYTTVIVVFLIQYNLL